MLLPRIFLIPYAPTLDLLTSVHCYGYRTENSRSFSPPFPNADELNQMAARFAPARLEVDLSSLSAGDKKALAKLIEAGRIVNHLFMQQFWSGDLALYQKLQQDKTPLGKARLHYFWINKGPWSEIDEHKAFLPGVPAKKPEGANFYPEDMTKEEFESWAKALYPESKTAAEGFFTVIRRGTDKKLDKNWFPTARNTKPISRGPLLCCEKLRHSRTMRRSKNFSPRALKPSPPTIILKAIWRGWTWTRRWT